MLEGREVYAQSPTNSSDDPYDEPGPQGDEFAVVTIVPAPQFFHDELLRADEELKKAKSVQDAAHQRKKTVQKQSETLDTDIAGLESKIILADNNIAALTKSLLADDTGTFGCFGSSRDSRVNAEKSKVEGRSKPQTN